MTTVVYDHANRIIACDSRVSEEGVILSDKFDKTRYRNGINFFFCGDVADYDTLVEAYFAQEKKVTLELMECRALAVCNGVVYSITVRPNGYLNVCPCAFSDAIGSGYRFALAALDHGLDAGGAIRYAMTRDAYTGGDVRLYDIENAEWTVLPATGGVRYESGPCNAE